MPYRRKLSMKQDQFRERWNWHRLVIAWHDEVGPLPHPLVQQYSLCAPGIASLLSEPLVTWWPRGKEREHWITLQLYIIEHPNHDPQLWIPQDTAGQRTTAASLCAASSIEEQIGILICASLRPHTDAPRPNIIPGWNSLLQIDEWAREAAGLSLQPWHHASRTVLPHVSQARMRGSDVVDGDSIIAAITRHHRELLSTWRPIKLVVDETGDPELVQAIRDYIPQKRAAKEQEHQEWLQQQQKEQDERARQMEEYRQRHPRAREWPPTAPVLRELVWSMPTTAIAEQFGVSDVAVGKLCDKLAVQKPPRGFWRKVETGRLPHPNGHPPKTTK